MKLLPEKEIVWEDERPSRVFNLIVATLGYFFFWGTELLLLYWLVQVLLRKKDDGFLVAAVITAAWTVASAYATVRLHRLTRQQRLLFLTDKAVGVQGKHTIEIDFAEVDKIIVAQANEGFEALVTAQETEFRAPLRDRKGFLEVCKKIEALKGKVASTGILD